MSIDTLLYPHRHEFVLAVNAYIEDLVNKHEIWLADDWNRDTIDYAIHHRRILRNVCSTCQYTRHHNVLNIIVPSTVDTTAKLESYLATHVKLPTETIRCLDERKVKSAWVLLYIKYSAWTYSHAALLVFDIKRKVQIVFDPDMEHNDDLCIASALSRRQLHPKYENIYINIIRKGYKNINPSIQERVEAHMSSDEQGVCGIISLVVMLVCLRFNYLNPLDVSNIIADYITLPSKRTLANQLITWYDKLIKTKDDKLLKHLFPPSTKGMCNVYIPDKKALCERPVCSDGSPVQCMCWQHRHLVINKKNADESCAARQKPCSYQQTSSVKSYYAPGILLVEDDDRAHNIYSSRSPPASRPSRSKTNTSNNSH